MHARQTEEYRALSIRGGGVLWENGPGLACGAQGLAGTVLCWGWERDNSIDPTG
jgi:hypothetical protein